MIRFFLLLITVSVAIPSFAQTNTQPQDPRIAAYQAHRTEHSEALKAEQRAFDEAVKKLTAEVEQTQIDMENEAKEISQMRNELAETRMSSSMANGVYYGLLTAIFPMFTVLGLTNAIGVTNVGSVETWVSICLIITVVNMFLVLVFREREVFQRHKKFFLWSLAVVLLILSIPAIAQGQNIQDEAADKLKLANEILGKSDHQRYIAILEAKLQPKISIPLLESGDPLLYVFSSVETMSAEYYFSLGALYTHENMLGKAVDSITAISSTPSSFNPETRDQIVINSVKFLLKKERRQAASDMLDKNLAQLNDVARILDLSKFLSDHGMSSSADSAQTHAINQAKTINELLQLTRFFEDGTDYDRATSALKRAAGLSKSGNDLIAVLKLAAQLNRDEIVDELIETHLPRVAGSFEEQVPVLDALMELGRREEATQMITNAVAEITPSHKNRVAALTHIIEVSLNRGFKEQALNSTMKLASYLGRDALMYQMTIPQNMESAMGLELPDNRVTLPLFWGLLNEESGFTDKAEVNYIRAVLSTLDRVANSYGYELPESLTDFQLLGRIWEADQQGALLQDLDAVYIHLEQHQLNLLKSRNQTSLTALKEQQAGLKSKQAGSQDAKAALVNEIRQQKSELRKRIFAIISAVIFAVVVIGVASWKAYIFAKPRMGQKTYAGATKFIEVLGWVQILSILNLVVGVSMIVIAQFFMLFHRNAENTSSKVG